MITDYFMITEKSNRLQVIMITDYDYPISVNIDINGKKTYETDPFCNGQLSINTCCVLHKMTCAGLSFVQYRETNFPQIKTCHFWYRRH